MKAMKAIPNGKLLLSGTVEGRSLIAEAVCKRYFLTQLQ
jgi:hypothetical protein